MRIVEFSVKNYRSITSAHKIKLKDMTVLVGRNNEGKSNLLNALNVAMKTLILHGMGNTNLKYIRSGRYRLYEWVRDFPLQFQNRKNGHDSIFSIRFKLENDEIADFQKETKIRGNEDIHIVIKIGKDNEAKIELHKRGTSSYNRKSKIITDFISKRIEFNYIQAIRTEEKAIEALRSLIMKELDVLATNEEYVTAQKRVMELQQDVLNGIAEQLIGPLKTFLPNLESVDIKQTDSDFIPRYMGREIEIFLDDGIRTNIVNKGEGIKSLVTLAILKERRRVSGGASIIAIEEPESHLHSGAIHRLVDVINKMSENNQVIITTHNPLFVQQNKISSNIIVNDGKAQIAKNIAEIRNILGVWASDNLRNARFVLVVEGEDDKISLGKLLPIYSTKIKHALLGNQLIIKCLSGAGNLSHDLNDLKHSMCKYVVLLDNDKAGREASEKAKNNGLLSDAILRHTICNGHPEAEFEDCLNPAIYKNNLLNDFSVNIDVNQFRGNQKWSVRIRNTFLSQGVLWNDEIEKKVKLCVAQSIPENITNIDDVVIPQKGTFIQGLVTVVERMLEDEQ